MISAKLGSLLLRNGLVMESETKNIEQGGRVKITSFNDIIKQDLANG